MHYLRLHFGYQQLKRLLIDSLAVESASHSQRLAQSAGAGTKSSNVGLIPTDDHLGNALLGRLRERSISGISPGAGRTCSAPSRT